MFPRQLNPTSLHIHNHYLKEKKLIRLWKKSGLFGNPTSSNDSWRWCALVCVWTHARVLNWYRCAGLVVAWWPPPLCKNLMSRRGRYNTSRVDRPPPRYSTTLPSLKYKANTPAWKWSCGKSLQGTRCLWGVLRNWCFLFHFIISHKNKAQSRWDIWKLFSQIFSSQRTLKIQIYIFRNNRVKCVRCQIFFYVHWYVKMRGRGKMILNWQRQADRYHISYIYSLNVYFES